MQRPRQRWPRRTRAWGRAWSLICGVSSRSCSGTPARIPDSWHAISSAPGTSSSTRGRARFVFASELRTLLEALPRTPGPDRPALVQWLGAGMVPADRTFYDGVVPLPPASVLRLQGGRWEAARYWTPRYVEPRPCGRRGGRRGSAGRRHGGGGPAAAGPPDGWGPGQRWPRLRHRAGGGRRPGRRERDLASSVLRGLPRLQILGREPVGSPPGRPSRPSKGAAARYRWKPDAGGAPVPRPLASASARARPFRVGASAGDGRRRRRRMHARRRDRRRAVRGGSVPSADRLRRGRVGDAFRLARDVPGVGPSPTRRLLLSLLYDYGVAAFLPPGLARRTAAREAVPRWLGRADARLFARSCDPQPWRSLEGPRWWAQLAHAVTRGPDLIGFWDYYRRRGRAAGIPAHHPFLDLDLIELVLRLPPEHGFDPNRNRPLLRRAMGEIMPEEVLARRDKSYFDPLLVDCLAVDDRRVVTSLLSAPDAEILSFADAAGVRALLDGGPSRHPRGASSWMHDVWRLANAECWLRSQGDPSFARTLLEGPSRQGDRPSRPPGAAVDHTFLSLDDKPL